MSEAELNGVKIAFSSNSVHISNSYLITDDAKKEKIINGILILCPKMKDTRTMDDMIVEWKAHNILYQHKYKRKHTKDVDFEYKQSKLHKLAFKMVTIFLRERK